MIELYISVGKFRYVQYKNSMDLQIQSWLISTWYLPRIGSLQTIHVDLHPV